jgi:hypothetical protein
MLKTTNLQMKVDENRSSLKLLLQKTSLKENLKKPKLKNQSIASRRGNTNSTSSFAKTRFENQSRAYRGANKSVETKSESKRKFRYIYHRLDLQLKIQKKFRLLFNLVIYSLKG